ncbi:MAG: creatininase family protein, partial [Bacteroidota bacterium]
FELAILPWGATEAHNYHLPYGTDVFESEAIAAESARLAWKQGARVIVLPSIPFGVNTGQSDIYLDINLNPTTQLAILDDIATVLSRQGLRKLMILNSHGGNNFKPLVRELGLRFPEMFICFTNWFQSLDKSQYFENEGDHADEMETSLMLHFKPELVLPPEHWGDGTSKKFKIPALRENWAWAERQWSEVTKDTGVGSPHAASEKKGEQFFKAVTLKMSDFILDLHHADLDNMYE